MALFNCLGFKVSNVTVGTLVRLDREAPLGLYLFPSSNFFLKNEISTGNVILSFFVCYMMYSYVKSILLIIVFLVVLFLFCNFLRVCLLLQ